MQQYEPESHWSELVGEVPQLQYMQSESAKQLPWTLPDVDPSKSEPDTSDKSLRPPQPTATRKLTRRATLTVARAFIRSVFICRESIELPVYLAPNPKSVTLLQSRPLSPMRSLTR